MGINKNIKRFVYFTILFFSTTTAFAHPHMWFTSQVDFKFSNDKLNGAYVTWTFDRFFSADIISGYDLNRDGKFNATETIDVYENAFEYTSNYYYFTFIRVGNSRTSPDYIDKTNFSVFQHNGIVSYRFYVDLSDFTSRDFFFACYDYTFYCDISYPSQNAITFSGYNSTINPKYTIVENKNAPVYYDPYGAMDDKTVYFKWKPGLETYYPKEIRIKY